MTPEEVDERPLVEIDYLASQLLEHLADPAGWARQTLGTPPIGEED